MALDFSECCLPPFAHQREDTERLVNSPFLFLTSEMRTGKTKIVIDAAQFLYQQLKIDRVVVIAPSPVRNVWFDPTFGELRKHLWPSTPASIIEFHKRGVVWRHGPATDLPMRWIVTNYEFLREDNLSELMSWCTRYTMLVLDESSFVKNHKAKQTLACRDLRRICGRVVLINGTPINHTPLDLFSQGNLLHPSILDCKFITHFKARYAVETPILTWKGQALANPKTGRPLTHVTKYRNLDDIQRRFAPHTIRRLQKDCLDLPPKLDPVVLTATLTTHTWRVYKDMRDELVVWLKSGDVATATTAAIKVLRLSQITSGFLGGIEEVLMPTATRTTEIGREKLDVLLWFLGQRLEEEGNPHIVTWCRFRAELSRLMHEVKKTYPQITLGEVRGDQAKEDRQYAMSLLHPETTPRGTPVFVGGTYGTGSYGLNFTGANTSINLSFDYSLGKYKQSSDRIYGPGMIGPAAYFDILAVGPNGQKTIDHTILAARRANMEVADWTVAAWVQALETE